MAMSPQPLAPIGAARSTVLITRLARAMRRQFEQAVAPLGLRSRHLVALTHLSDHGPSPQQTLIEALGLDASNLVALLNELEDAELIVRRRDRADRRRGIIELSPEGERMLALVDRALEAVDDEILVALSTDERATLNELLARAGAAGPLDCPQETACEAAEAEECEAAVAGEFEPPSC
jgi:DNA-binding MarR family transcriptional regulator